MILFGSPIALSLPPPSLTGCRLPSFLAYYARISTSAYSSSSVIIFSGLSIAFDLPPLPIADWHFLTSPNYVVFFILPAVVCSGKALEMLGEGVGIKLWAWWHSFSSQRTCSYLLLFFQPKKPRCHPIPNPFCNVTNSYCKIRDSN